MCWLFFDEKALRRLERKGEPKEDEKLCTRSIYMVIGNNDCPMTEDDRSCTVRFLLRGEGVGCLEIKAYGGSFYSD